MDALSLFFLAITIALALLKKLNVGLVAMGVSLVLARFGNIDDNRVLAGFPTSTFLNLFGVTFWFAVINQSGVVELLGKKTVIMAGNSAWIIPFLLMFLGFAVAYIGPGAIPALLLCAMSISLAREVNAKPMLYVLPTFLGVCAGRFSMFSPEGLWLKSFEESYGYSDLIGYFTLCNFFASALCTVICFIYYKGWQTAAMQQKTLIVEAFNKYQLMALASAMVLLLLIVVFRMNSALSCLLVGLVLLLLGLGKEKNTFMAMPFETMFLVCGMGMLVTTVNQMGGIHLLSDILGNFITPSTSSAIMGIIAGIMGTFSSSFGVVYPTLMPTVPDIVASFGDEVYALPILFSIAYGAAIAGISPLSTAGSLCLTTIALDKRNGEKQLRHYYKAFFAWTLFFIFFNATLAFLGLFDMIALLFSYI